MEQNERFLGSCKLEANKFFIIINYYIQSSNQQKKF